MARAKGKSTIEKIEDTKLLIEQKNMELKELQEQLEELYAQKKEEDKEVIYQKMKDKNMTLDELLNLLEK